MTESRSELAHTPTKLERAMPTPPETLDRDTVNYCAELCEWALSADPLAAETAGKVLRIVSRSASSKAVQS